MKICLTPLLLLLMSKVLCIHGDVQPSHITEVSPALSQGSARTYGNRTLLLLSSKAGNMDIGKPLEKLMKEDGAEHQTVTPPSEIALALASDDPQTSHSNVKPGENHREGARAKVLQKRSLFQTKARVKRFWKKKSEAEKIQKKDCKKLGKKWTRDGKCTVPNNSRKGWKKWDRSGKTPEETSSRRKDWKKWDRSGVTNEKESDDTPGAPDDNQEAEKEDTDEGKSDDTPGAPDDNQEAGEEDEVQENEDDQNEDLNEDDEAITDDIEETPKSRKDAWKKWDRSGKGDQDKEGDSTDTNRRKQAWGKWNRNGKAAGTVESDATNSKGGRKSFWGKWKNRGTNM